MSRPSRRVGFTLSSVEPDFDVAFLKEPLPSSAMFVRLDGENDANAERRRNTIVDAEYNAVTCIALYLLLMSFSQKGIDKLRVHQEGMKMRDPEGRLEVSEGFDDGLCLFHCSGSGTESLRFRSINLVFHAFFEMQ